MQQSDAVQNELREGPCFDALRLDETFEITEMTRETRWPRYAARAARLGIGSVLGYQLSVGQEGAIGALNLHGAQPRAFGERSRKVGAVFAAQAAVALAWANTEAQLKEAIRSRQRIGAAIGVLMERHKVTEEAGFAMLSRASQRANVKLREIAERVLESGEDPVS